MAISRSPWLGSVTLAAPNTAYRLSALLISLSDNLRPNLQFKSCQYVAIQLDTSAGAAELFVGNENLSSSFCGISIFSGQTWPVYSVDSNLISLDNIYLLSDTAGVQCNIAFLVR